MKGVTFTVTPGQASLLLRLIENRLNHLDLMGPNADEVEIDMLEDIATTGITPQEWKDAFGEEDQTDYDMGPNGEIRGFKG